MTQFNGTNNSEILPSLQETAFALGDDQVNAFGGDDIVFGWTGDDVLNGGAGSDVLIGGVLNVVGNFGTTQIAGIDTADYSDSDESVSVDLSIVDDYTVEMLGLEIGLTGAARGFGGHAQGDYLTGFTHLTGSAFGDFLGGDDDDNTLNGGLGDDELQGGLGADILIGGLGQDTASYRSSDSGLIVDLSDTSNNTGAATGDIFSSIENLSGSNFDDTLTGDSNGNVLNGGSGADALNGGDGHDIASYAGATSGAIVNLLDISQNAGAASGDTFTSIEGFSGTDFSDAADGDDGGNSLFGRGGDDTLNGGKGDDLIEGGAGADTIEGGEGLDTASYATSAEGVYINLFTQTFGSGDAAGDTLVGVENLVGSAFDDFLVGDRNENTIDGGAGNDTINGSVDDDILIGGLGDDELVGSFGADSIDGGEGSDTAGYFQSLSGVNVNLLTGATSGGDSVGDVFTSIENLRGSEFNDVLTGDSGANVLIGGSGADELNGGSGEDTLNGAQGNDLLNGGDDDDFLNGGIGVDVLVGGNGDDTLIGGRGSDTLQGGDGSDTASYFSSVNGVAVDLAGGTAGLGDASGDVLSGIENLTGSNSGNDKLIGDAGANRLEGFGGSDRITGGLGDDEIALGNQDGVRDLAIFDTDGFGNDHVQQFENGIDILDVRGLNLSFNDVVATQAGTSTMISFDGVSGQISLANFNMADLDAGDFYF